MRGPATAATSVAWFVLMGGTFGCLLPYLLGYWQFHQPAVDSPVRGPARWVVTDGPAAACGPIPGRADRRVSSCQHFQARPRG